MNLITDHKLRCMHQNAENSELFFLTPFLKRKKKQPMQSEQEYL